MEADFKLQTLAYLIEGKGMLELSAFYPHLIEFFPHCCILWYDSLKVFLNVYYLFKPCICVSMRKYQLSSQHLTNEVVLDLSMKLCLFSLGWPPSGDDVTINMPYEVDVLHRPASDTILSYWVG